MKQRIALTILFGLSASFPGRTQTFNEIFPTLPKQSQTAIIAINVGHGLAQKCRIPFNRNSVFANFERRLRQNGQPETDIAKTRRAFLQFSSMFDKTPRTGQSAAPCDPKERPRNIDILRRMQSGVFPEG